MRVRSRILEELSSTRFAINRVPRILLVAFLVGVYAASIAANTTVNAQPQEWSLPARYENYLPILSDFDGDGRLDQAELHVAGTHHCIRVRFGSFRETHLDLGARSLSGGMLLVRDVNNDNNLDLIWVYRSSFERTLVWLNDGAGHFAKSNVEDVDVAANSLFSDRDYTVSSAFGDERICLAPARQPSDFVPIANFDNDSCEIPLIIDRDSCNYSGLDFACLRERGPPAHV